MGDENAPNYGIRVESGGGGSEVKFAYADPPYIGQAQRHYSADPLCAEVDHAALIQRLVRDFPDGWALSASSSSLGQIIPILNTYVPPGWRIAVWCKSFCAFKRNVRALLRMGARHLLRGSQPDEWLPRFDP